MKFKMCAIVGVLVAFWQPSYSQVNTSSLQTFPLSAVRLLESPFKQAQETDMKYMLSLNPDRLLAPYLREAGLTPKAQSYTNWENTGLDGHIGGHYLSALSMMYGGTNDKAIMDRLNYMLAELKKCQDKNGDGYIGGVPGSSELWKAVFQGDVAAIRKRWVPLYNIHKTYAGIRDAYLIAGIQEARPMLIKFSDWFVRLADALNAAQMEEMLKTEHGGVNEILADVYGLTGDKKYLKAAYSFSHKAILEPLEKSEDKLDNIHANTQIPKIIGFKRIGDLAGDEAYKSAAKFFWETVVNHRTVAIGGNSVFEHFNPVNNFTTMITSEQGPETCNSYNMLKLTRLLYQSEPAVKYIDYYERTLYNHILSTQHPGNGGFVYFTSMRPGGYRVYSQAQTSMWCCVGSGMENQAKYDEMIYAHNSHDLYVNLFIPSKLDWKEQGLQLTQQTSFPEDDKSTLQVEKSSGNELTINFRYPSWVTKGELKIWLNGKPLVVTAQPSSWISIKRRWLKGDRVMLQLPMHTTTEQMPAGLNYFAILHGPIVLAAKIDSAEMTGLYADDSRMGHIAQGRKYPLQDMPMLVSNDTNIASYVTPVAGKPFTFSASNLIQPSRYKNLELIPFYKLHDARYVIYWQKETPGSLVQIKQRMANEEAALARLDNMTTDMVRTGEQQPESDHFMETDRSNAGINQDRHWRSAKGWFSYKLRNPKIDATKLRLTYYGRDRDRSFDIYINGTLLTHVNQDGTGGDQFMDVTYPLPADMTKVATMEVKFVASAGSAVANIYEVRLMK